MLWSPPSGPSNAGRAQPPSDRRCTIQALLRRCGRAALPRCSVPIPGDHSRVEHTRTSPRSRPSPFNHRGRREGPSCDPPAVAAGGERRSVRYHVGDPAGGDSLGSPTKTVGAGKRVPNEYLACRVHQSKSAEHARVTFREGMPRAMTGRLALPAGTHEMGQQDPWRRLPADVPMPRKQSWVGVGCKPPPGGGKIAAVDQADHGTDRCRHIRRGRWAIRCARLSPGATRR